MHWWYITYNDVTDIIDKVGYDIVTDDITELEYNDVTDITDTDTDTESRLEAVDGGVLHHSSIPHLALPSWLL